MVINLEWKTTERGAVKTALYRPANLQVVVRSAKYIGEPQAKASVSKNTKPYELIWHTWGDTMADCQYRACKWLSTRASHSLWDSEYLAVKIQAYLQGYPLAMLEYQWAEKLGDFCNSPAEVVSHQPGVESHKAWLKTERQRLNLIEAKALNALTFVTREADKELILNILGREVE